MVGFRGKVEEQFKMAYLPYERWTVETGLNGGVEFRRESND